MSDGRFSAFCRRFSARGFSCSFACGFSGRRALLKLKPNLAGLFIEHQIGLELTVAAVGDKARQKA